MVHDPRTTDPVLPSSTDPLGFNGSEGAAHASATRALRSCVDANGRLIPMSDEELRRRNEAARLSLRELEAIGEDQEQSETWDYLRRVLDEDRLSDRI